MSALHHRPTVPARDLAHLRQRAQDLAGRGDHRQALAVLRTADQLAPGNLDIQVDLAVALYEADDHFAALAPLERVLAAQPGHVESRFLHALCHHRLGNKPFAIDGFTQVTTGAAAAALQERAPRMAEVAHALLAQLREEMRPAADAPPCGQLAGAAVDPRHPRWAATGAAKYDFSHLDQPGHQRVAGPIQDDEALLLYATVRVMRMRRILEVGGLAGYSARNFLRAMQADADIALYTVDLNPVPSLGPHHHTIVADCARLQAADVHHLPLDLVFLDAHVVEAQLGLIDRLEEQQLLHSHTVIALHDTNLHRVDPGDPRALVDSDGQVGWAHQPAERRIVNVLHGRGWQTLNFHMPLSRSDAVLPCRHGLTLMRRFAALNG